MYDLTHGEILSSAIVALVACIAFIVIWVWQYKTEGLLINPKKDPRCLLAWFVAVTTVGLTGWLAFHFFSML